MAGIDINKTANEKLPNNEKENASDNAALEEPQKDKLVFKKEDVFLIPNIITYFRFLCIPAFVTLCLVSWGSAPLIYWAFGVFLVASASDLVDGKIARKYNMVSDIGKVFDPLADKLMHVSVILSLTIIGFVPWYFIAFIFLKEGVMVALTPMLVKKKIIIPAVWQGKAAAFVLTLAVLAAFFHPYVNPFNWFIGKTPIGFDWILMLIGCLLAFNAAMTYIMITHRKLKEFNKRLADGLIDIHGNLTAKGKAEAAKMEEEAQEKEEQQVK